MPASIEAWTLRSTVSFLDCSVPPPALVDHPPQPGNLAFIALRCSRLLERIELEVRVRVDEAWNDRDVAQIQIARPLSRRPNPGDPAALDRQAPVLDRRTLDRKDIPRLERERAASHREISLEKADATSRDA